MKMITNVKPLHVEQVMKDAVSHDAYIMIRIEDTVAIPIQSARIDKVWEGVFHLTTPDGGEVEMCSRLTALVSAEDEVVLFPINDNIAIFVNNISVPEGYTEPA